MKINNAFFAFILKRLLNSVILLVIVMSLVFFANRQIGDPARMVLGNGASEEAVLNLRTQMGLEDPMSQQYGRFLYGLATGDLGKTFRFGLSDSVRAGNDANALSTLPIAMDRLPATLILAGATIIFSVLVALPLGLYAAARPRSPPDRAIGVLSLAGVSIVEYWFALVLVLVFAVQFAWFPTSGYGTVAHVVLPALALSLRPIGRITQIARSSLLDEMAKPYITAAKGRGIPMRRVAAVHALKNAAIPIVTTIGDETINVVTGVIIIETIFGWPGIGALTVDALSIRDIPLVEATVFLLVLMVLTINLLVDVAYAFLNPRLRIG
ncbi:ABC transporter permease [Rhodobacteraceae bacterium]|nr:ABC transporter permease [Paracoccaceae bacterium]